MNNIEKKLDALIDALGFDVKEESCIIMTDGEIYSGKDITELKLQLIDEIRTDYKLTKRTKGDIKCTKCGTHLANNSPLYACMCKTPLNLVRY